MAEGFITRRGGTSGATGLALNAVTNIETQAASEKVYVKWTDPNDITFEGTTLAQWAGTLLVRKAGSMPANRRDGVAVIDSTVKNQYSNTYFIDSGLSNNTTYYYKFFPYTASGVYTDSDECEFTAVPTAQVEGIEDWLVTGMYASTEAGNGKMNIKWTDPAATITVDGQTLATWGSTTVVVKAGSYATSKDDADAAYTLKSTTRNQYASTALTVSGLTNGTTYYVSFFPETTDGGINTAISQRVSGVANRITISAVPAQSSTLTYNGNTQSPSWSNYDTGKMTLGGSTTGTNAGSYGASFTPRSDYRWSDGTTTAKTVEWTIQKAAGTLSLSATSVTLNSDATTATVTVTRAGDGAISAVSNDTSVATVSVSGATLTISSVNDTTGEAVITVSVAEGTNYAAPANKTIAVSAQFRPAVGTALNDCSWDDISWIAEAGLAGSYFEVGDRKAVVVNGTVGTLEVNDTYYVYIIGIAHNGATNTIDFGTFKTALSGGTDICLIDSKYNSSDTSGAKYFNINHWGRANYGGWKGCDMRYDVLGSTNVEPSGYGAIVSSGRTGYDATATCATSPVANTLMAALPSDLRAVMKPMTIYTDNTGGGSNTASYVTASVDYLPLLAEYEIFGSRSYANSAEKNYQAQYAYYSSGNSKAKYRHSSTGSTACWWERSARYDSGNTFCSVITGGSASSGDATDSRGLAPAFRV